MGGKGVGEQVQNREVILVSYPKGLVQEENFHVRESELDLTVKECSGDVLLKTLYLSLDPYLRLLMQERQLFINIPRFELGERIHSSGIAKVIASDNPKFKAGDFVGGHIPFSEYSVAVGGEGLQKIDPDLAPLSYYLGVLGLPGLTAWAGLKLIGQPKPGEQVFVSAAAGAVGQVVGQLAKIWGCRVVGSASSDKKVELLKLEFGYDDAFNYKKETDLNAALGKYFPKGIDIYFENVGGEMLEAVLNHVNLFARIPVCGLISQYNLGFHENHGVRNLMNLIVKSVRMEGFTVTHFVEEMPKYIQEMSSYLKEGKLKYKEHVTEGIENLPLAFVGFFKSENIGKAVVRVGTP